MNYGLQRLTAISIGRLLAKPNVALKNGGDMDIRKETHHNQNTHTHHHGCCGGSVSGGMGRWFFWAIALLGGYFLITEHRAHLAAIWPFLFLLVCPLMHMFHGHGGHHHNRREVDDQQGSQQ